MLVLVLSAKEESKLAADFSVTQFSFLTKLLLWHGRNSYRRSAKLAQVVIHRGLIISIMQVSALGHFFYEMLMIVDVDAAVGHSFIESQTDHYRYRSDFSEFGLKGHKEIHCIGPKSHFCSLQCGTIRKPLGRVAGILEEKKCIASVLNRTFAPYSVEPSLP